VNVSTQNVTLSSSIDNEWLVGVAGNDILNGKSGDDILEGGDGKDVLRGGRGRDLLLGGNGEDILCGGFSTDTLTGGNGADVFVFRAKVLPGADSLLADVITDFNAAEGDKIGLMRGLSRASLLFEVFDSNGDGIADATVVKLGSSSNERTLAVVLDTVDAMGATTLTDANFITVTSHTLALG
jgi:Ca2+-binding RTX toxin-like protein